MLPLHTHILVYMCRYTSACSRMKAPWKLKRWNANRMHSLPNAYSYTHTGVRNKQTNGGNELQISVVCVFIGIFVILFNFILHSYFSIFLIIARLRCGCFKRFALLCNHTHIYIYKCKDTALTIDVRRFICKTQPSACMCLFIAL